MSRRILAWAIPAIAYAAFFAWYTNLSGPLDEEETAGYLALLEANEMPPESIATLRRFMEEDSGDDFYVLNALDLRDTPEQIGEVGPDESSEEVLGRYMAHMYPELLRRACHPTLFGPAVAPVIDLVGLEDADGWTAGGFMRYRSRRDLLDIATNPVFREKHGYKLAALDKTIAYPIEPVINLGELRFLLALIALLLALALDRRRA